MRGHPAGSGAAPRGPRHAAETRPMVARGARAHGGSPAAIAELQFLQDGARESVERIAFVSEASGFGGAL